MGGRQCLFGLQAPSHGESLCDENQQRGVNLPQVIRACDLRQKLVLAVNILVTNVVIKNDTVFCLSRGKIR